MFKQNLELLKFGINILKHYYVTNSIKEGGLLFSFTLNINTVKLPIYYNYKTSYKVIKEYINIIERRAFKEPVAYITEKKEFYSNTFYINRSVLIPRSETELIVDYLLSKGVYSSILDLGIGSGNILLSIASSRSKYLYGVDNSWVALKVAKKNSLLLKCSHIPVLSNITFEVKHYNRTRYVVSNPPYIRLEDYNFLMEDVKRFEPLNALLARDKGLFCYKTIAANSRSNLLPNGKVIVEIGIGELDEVVYIFKKKNFRLLKIMNDLVGIPRTLIFGLV